MKIWFRHSTALFKYSVSFIVFLLAMIFVGDGKLLKRSEQWKEIDKLKTEIDAYNRRFEHDKAELTRMKNSPEALRKVARERYHMQKETEDVFIVEDF